MRRFDPNVYESNSEVSGDNLSKTTRDPYFERYSLQIYQELSENPSALFNFFFENNDILKKIDKNDYNYLCLVYKRWSVMCNNALFGTIVGMGALDFFFLRKSVGPKVPKFLKPVYFLFKYIGMPMISFKLTDLYLNIEEDFLDCAGHYNFGYEDFEQAMAIFEKAKIVNKLDLLLEQRGDFDMSQLDNIELDYSKDEPIL